MQLRRTSFTVFTYAPSLGLVASKLILVLEIGPP